MSPDDRSERDGNEGEAGERVASERPAGAASPARLEMRVVESRVHERLFGAASHAVSIGRFSVLGSLGAGGMGVVFAAHDPELERKVAIKLVAIGRTGASASSQERLLVEAQTMARLSHPNLVTVHEVGTHEGGVYVAMEYIDGETLDRWLARTQPRWPEIVDVFVQAGQGLAAAHREGVVHRDFKPSNAMIDRSGRVRVLDFGLAGTDGEDTLPSGADEERSRSSIGGTPLFMAPEQHCGAAASVRTDIYAFCIALWTALFGEHPFARASLEATLTAMLNGVAPTPTGAAVPAWLRRTLQRGLARDPETRWPRMDSLLDALARGRQRARRMRIFVGLAAVGLTAAGIVAVRDLDVRRRAAACESAGASIQEVWNEDARAAMRASMGATGLGYATVTVERVGMRMDAHADEWQLARTEACMDADLRGVWDPDTLDRSLWCLDERRTEMESLVHELVRADASVVQNAVEAAAALASSVPCRDAGALARLPLPPTEQREQVRALRAELARARALVHAGRPAEALEVVRGMGERTAAIGWPPLSAAVRAGEAMLLEEEGNYDASEAAAREAYFEAARVGAWNVATNVAIGLVGLVGDRLSRPADAMDWAQHAEIAATHAGDPDHLYESRRLAGLGNAHAIAGDYPEALALHERALSLREASLGEDHPWVAAATAEVAQVHTYAGDYPRARELYGQTITRMEAAFGPDHPRVAGMVNNLGHAIYGEGDYADARAHYERALAILERAGLPSDHPQVVNHRESLAIVLGVLGESARALELLEDVLAVHEKVYGSDSPNVAGTLHNLAMVHFQKRDYASALAAAERALAIEQKAFGADHQAVAASMGSVAVCLQELGEIERAREMLERALAIGEAGFGSNHPEVALLLSNLAALHDELDQPARAKEYAVRAVAIYDAHPGEQTGESTARAVLEKK